MKPTTHAHPSSLGRIAAGALAILNAASTALAAFILTLPALWAMSTSALAANVVTFDFNDGTKQGWQTTSNSSNDANRFRGNNSGNGSLQFFGPVAASSLNETDVIRFEVEFGSYNTVSSPSQLTSAYFTLRGNDGELSFSMDMSGLAFGQTRVFTFTVSDGVYSDVTINGTSGVPRATFLMTNPVNPDMLWADPSFNSNTASALMDNFTINTAAPTNTELSTGDAVSNVAGATVSKLYPAAVGGNNNVYCLGKIAGGGATSGDDDCLLRWDAATGEVTAIVREGAALAGGTIAKLGAPVISGSGTQLAYTVTLAIAGAVTKANDTLLCVSDDSLPVSPYPIMREGDVLPGAGTRKATTFAWMHWTADDVLFIGASAKDAAASPTTLAGAWVFNGSLVPAVLPGDAITVDGTATTVSSVSLPAAKKPAAAQTRVGNRDSVSLLIKTADGKQVIKRYLAPASYGT